MNKPIVLDIETKNSFREVNNDLARLGVSCVGVYEYYTNTFKAYLEDDFKYLFPVIENASLVIGFNIDRFDFPVLNSSYLGELSNIPTLDLLTSIKNSFGKRISLDDLAKETLGANKSGHGLLAIEYYREGKIDELIKYCLDDVKITRDLYEFGKRKGEVYYKGHRGRNIIRVDWSGSDTNNGGGDVNLTLGI